IRGKAMASSLEATGWGSAFPDLMRVVLPPLPPSTDDRGQRIEDTWRKRLSCGVTGNWDMEHLAEGAAAGKLPLAIFNATIAETGQRMLLTRVRALPSSQRPARPAESADARELSHLYPHSRMEVSTAARLSATFSYVTPICRP